MFRRRRPKREIAFSFDSFLDVVANVCGIIIRLILVAWVGGRAYHEVTTKHALEAPTAAVEATSSDATTAELPPLTDPLEPALQRHKEELANQQQRLLDQLRNYQMVESTTKETSLKLAALTASETFAQQERAKLERAKSQEDAGARSLQLSLADLEKRSRQLEAELLALEKEPSTKKILRYRTPVSRPVHTEELHFECQGGRVSFIDLDAFLIEIRRTFEDKANLLKTQWQAEGTTSTVGAFRLHFVVEREQGLLDNGASPNSAAGFRYGLSGWIVEPTSAFRGATAAAALTPGSEFYQLANAIDPEHTVVTMWVYPDSFALYRQLRDFLHERNVEVAGRPLLPGVPIASSRRGTASRGQ